jgi:hypothetical protein
MARIRLTAARGTAPLGQPPIANARDIQIPRPLYFPYPTLIHIPIHPEEAGGFARPEMRPPPVSDGGFDRLASPPLLRTRPALAVRGRIAPLPARLGGEPILGGRFPPLPRWPKSGPTKPLGPLTREAGDGAFSFAEVLSLLRARLEPARETGPLRIEAPGTEAASTEPRLRPYQEDAMHHLLAHESFLLADELGTGKTVTACAALHRLVSQGEVRRALIICQEAAKAGWARSLTEWAPGLVAAQVDGEPSGRSHAWNAAAHVIIVDYPTLSDDVRSGRLSGTGLEWDLVILDDALAARRHAIQPIPEYERLLAHRRWSLSSVVPRRAEEWLTIFLFLTPGAARGGAATLPDLERRFQAFTLHRSKADLADQLPALTRDRIWVTLDRRQRVPYWEILEEERRRLAELGGAVTRAHIEKAVARLKMACNFAPASLDGAKIVPLVDLAEDVSGSNSKMVVFSQFRQESLDRLLRVLEAFGALRLDSLSSPAEQSQTLRRFQDDDRWHVLLADYDLRPDSASLPTVGTVLHFDHRWNPAERRRAEQRLHPDSSASAPLNVYEYWVMGTVDERIDAILAEQGLFPEDLPPQLRPAELEDRLTTADWLGRILEVPGHTTSEKIASLP